MRYKYNIDTSLDVPWVDGHPTVEGFYNNPDFRPLILRTLGLKQSELRVGSSISLFYDFTSIAVLSLSPNQPQEKCYLYIG